MKHNTFSISFYTMHIGSPKNPSDNGQSELQHLEHNVNSDSCIVIPAFNNTRDFSKSEAHEL